MTPFVGTSISAGHVCLFALSESTSSGAGFVGFLVGIGAGVLTHAVFEAFKTWQTKGRLLKALLVDCTQTLSKMDGVMPRLKVDSENNPALATVDLAKVRPLTSSINVSPPLEQTRELIALLSPPRAREIILYWDRWSLFFTLAARYADVYDKLLIVTADPEANAEVVKEYWGQAIYLLRLLYKTANELGQFACIIFRQHGPATDLSLSDSSHGRWKTSSSLVAEKERYLTLIQELERR
jgi:hypothetical protein